MTAYYLRDDAPVYWGVVAGPTAHAPNVASSSPVLPALEGAVTIYDRDTARHSAQVAATSAAMARRLNLSEAELQTVWWAATLHDLGKLSVRVEVLHKLGRLDEAEWAEVRRHPAVGSDLLLALSTSLGPIALAVRAHHERWDGSGYPDGLRGEGIPLLGRVIAIADAFDSMTRRRPYRARALVASEAVRAIQDQSGRQFDPLLVALFVELQDNGLIVSG